LKKSYHVLEDGNDLYAKCQNAEDNLKTEGDSTKIKASAGIELFYGGICWGYIESVVDSIPAGEGFEPDAKVRLNQYVDLVTAYLRDNPKLRHEPAYYLIRTAVSKAFPEKQRN
jgi:hypothetical protein